MWLVLVTFIVTLICYLVHKQMSYWKNRGVPGPRPLPLIGNLGTSLIGKKSFGDIVNEVYREYEQRSFVGIFMGTTPALLIRDTDFIRNITTKDFKHFQNNNIVVDKEVDPLFGRNPFCLKDDEWKKARAQLTPCFTSVKMKNLFPFIQKVGKAMVTFVENQQEATNTDGMEAKALCSRFTLDNVGLCAFGLDGKCFEEPKSEFRTLAERFFSQDLSSSIKFILVSIIPKLASVISIKFVPKDVEEHLVEIVKKTIRYREENNIVRNDFLDYIHQLSKSSSSFTEIDVAAHAASFFVDGFETSAQMMSFVLFELALNLDVQTKLREEINKYSERDNKELTCESILAMPYLDACLNESIRKYPPIHFLSKICNQTYTYTPSNPDYKNTSITVEPETSIILPVSALQMDPKYFPSPEKFMPERFLRKEDINRHAFLPFGEGPRACLGQRFGVLQIKIGVTYLIQNFEMKVNKKTTLPLVFDPWNFLLAAKGGLWLNFNKIQT